MRVIVAGSRGIANRAWIRDILYGLCIDVPYENSPLCYMEELVCGMAKGPDLIAREFAEHTRQAYDVKIKITDFPADWDAHGKKAGILRNIQMGDYADALIAFWDGKSRGTKHMIDYMLSLGKEVHVYVDKTA